MLMATSDPYTHRATQALESAGFEESKAHAIVTTITAVTDDRIAAIVGNLPTKEQFEALATKDQFKALATRMEVEAKGTKDQFKALATRMEFEAKGTKERLAATATREELTATAAELRGEMRTEFAGLRTGIAVEFKELYRHLWMMSAGIVALTVTLVKLIP